LAPAAAAQIPRPEQHTVAAAVAHALAGHGSRVLVIAADGPAWDSAMDTWTRARAHEGAVVGLLSRPRSVPAPQDDGQRALAWTPRGLVDLAGTRQPATVVVTPQALDTLTELHRAAGDRPLAPWDLIVTASSGPEHLGAPHDGQGLPTAARLTLTSTHPRRLPRQAGPVVVRRSALLAAQQGLMRGHRLLAVPHAGAAGTPDSLAALILEVARRHGLRRVQVVCASAPACRRLTEAVGRAARALPAWLRPASLWTGTLTPTLPAGRRDDVVWQFAQGHEDLLVLAAHGPHRATGADALLVAAPYDEHTAGEAVEWALETRGRHDGLRTLVVLVPLAADGTGRTGTEALVRACAALDPALVDRAAQHPATSRWPWIEGGPYLDTGQHRHLDAAARALTAGQAS
ncbi:hypothetical protein, partial [Streptomyces sp. CBMA156]